MDKLLHLLNRDGSDVFYHNDIFKTASKILEQLSVDEEDIIPEHQTWAAAPENVNNIFFLF